MRSTRAVRTRKVRETIFKAKFQQGALAITQGAGLNFVVRLEILAGAKFCFRRKKHDLLPALAKPAAIRGTATFSPYSYAGF
jgi:hypothetical protein